MADAPETDGPVEIGTTPAPDTQTIDIINGEPETEEPQPDDADKPAEGEEEQPKDEPLRDDKGRYKGGVQARIDELTRKAAEATRRAARAEEQLSARSTADAPTAKPTEDQFESYGDFVEALTDWKADQREASRTQTEATDATKEAEQHRGAAWAARIGEAKSTIADFDAVMDKADTPTAPHVANAIMDADRGPELLYHLAHNPELVDKLNGMSPMRAAIELGRIETTLDAPAERPKPRETTQSKAPAPITPVQPGASTSKDPAKMSQSEYNEWRKGQLK